MVVAWLASEHKYLDVGKQFVYILLDGLSIHAQGINPRYVEFDAPPSKG